MKKLFLLTLIFSLSACSWYNSSIYTSRPHQYVKARDVKSLEVPNGMSRPTESPQFAIPPCDSEKAQDVSLLPPGSLVAALAKKK